ncbi:MGMT family protein [Allobranchiibius sp. GilTou73]|uniref:MGMT family protein n=1 Tax=Allobranchiibius sp. GilTou73 TaxID=2904523 RepID=UPI001F21AFC0|nr:MGMT family protein [Allobranchiibius sp. GilTou73]UIJ35022.1 MGMT family protein [Allobranchiibius sp. GilTou73]
MDLRSSVYAIVRLVPPGTVVSYGDIAGMLAMSPRMVGRFMALCEEEDVPWWRVVSSYGDLPAHVRVHALDHWDDEGLVLKPNGLGVAIRRYRADLADLADAAEAVLGPLPGLADDDSFTG